MKEDAEVLIQDIKQYSLGLVKALEEDRYDDILEYKSKMESRLKAVSEYAVMKKKLR